MPAPTIAQRIVRAKARIKSSAAFHIEYPVGAQLPDRLAGVLRWCISCSTRRICPPSAERRRGVDLADEAIRLGSQLAELMPDEPEVLGLLALMLAQHARTAARFDANGDLIMMEDQPPRCGTGR